MVTDPSLTPSQVALVIINLKLVGGTRGLTVIVKVIGVLLHGPVTELPVAVMVAITGLVPVFTGVKEAILPVPLSGKPIPGVSLTQLKVFAVPVKLIAAVAAPLARTWLDTAFIVGNTFTVQVTATFWLTAPVEVNVTLPDKLPGKADAADLT